MELRQNMLIFAVTHLNYTIYQEWRLISKLDWVYLIGSHQGDFKECLCNFPTQTWTVHNLNLVCTLGCLTWARFGLSLETVKSEDVCDFTHLCWENLKLLVPKVGKHETDLIFPYEIRRHLISLTFAGKNQILFMNSTCVLFNAIF